MALDKKSARLRRARRARSKIRELRVPRLSVHRSSQHIYAQVIDDASAKVIATASTMDKAVRGDIANAGNKDAAAQIGKLIAERAKENGVESVAFDRSGFKYHGRIKALADAAREAGLNF